MRVTDQWAKDYTGPGFDPVTRELAADLIDARKERDELSVGLAELLAGRVPMIMEGQAALMARVKALEEALTPSGDTKADYSGDFKFTDITGTSEEGDDIESELTVPWTTIKEIMARILKRAAA